MAVPNIADIRTDWRFIRDDPDWQAFRNEVNGWGIELVFLALFNISVSGGSGGSGTSAATITAGIDGSSFINSIDSSLQAIVLAVDGVESQLGLIEGSTEGTRLAVRGEAGLVITANETINSATPGQTIDVSGFEMSHCGDVFIAATVNGGDSIEVQFEGSPDGTNWFGINDAITFTTSDSGIPFYTNRTFNFVRVNVLSQAGAASIDYVFTAKRA